MKNIFKILVVAVMITGLWSCENEDNFRYLEAPPAAFAILTPDNGTSILLTEDIPASNSAVTFTWEEVDYGTPTVVTYTVQFAKNGTDFAAPIDVSSSTITHATLTVAELNARVNELENIIPGEDNAIDVRIRSTVGTTGSEEKFSDVITIVVNPYSLLVAKREIFLVGSATAAGWSNDNDNQPMFRDPVNENLYTFTGYFVAGDFKTIEVKGQWAPMYGVSGTNVVPRPTEADPDPSSWNIPSDGYYTFTLNLETLTFTLSPYLGDTATTYTTIGLIGSARTGDDSGWSEDTDMANPWANNPHLWKVSMNLFNGEAKFRTNNDWATNWGGDTPWSGTATMGGGNIPVEAAVQYDVWFNDLDGKYVFIPILD